MTPNNALERSVKYTGNGTASARKIVASFAPGWAVPRPAQCAVFTDFRATWLLFALPMLCACTLNVPEPTWEEPKIVPAGWDVDFDYQSDLRPYLRGQHDSARLEGATAYVYVYSDGNPHCQQIRGMLKIGVVAAAFRDVRITMLSLPRLRWLHRATGIGFDPGDIAPAMARIHITGDLAGPFFYPDMFLNHAHGLSQSHHRLQKGTRPITVTGFAEVMREYFQANNET